MLVLFQQNEGYVGMLRRQYPELTLECMRFNHHKLVPTEHKLGKLVETSYQINRQAFYAYGSFLSYFAGNMITSVFKTSLLDVGKLAKGFGFAVPPRVKAEAATFLNKKAQDRLKHQKRKLKLQRRKLRKAALAKASKATSRPVEEAIKQPEPSLTLRVKRKKIARAAK